MPQAPHSLHAMIPSKKGQKQRKRQTVIPFSLPFPNMFVLWLMADPLSPENHPSLGISNAL
eukprot:scaffold184764_cov78-Attheya_sp.AAC.1